MMSYSNEPITNQYQSILSRLKENETQKEHPLLGKINAQELYKVRLKTLGEIEDICYASKEVCAQLKKITNGQDCYYKQLIWSIHGKIDTTRIMNQYSQAIKEMVLLRTIYLYRQLTQPIQIVYSPQKQTFPIHDLTQTPYHDQVNLIKNTLAANARKPYNPEIDIPFKIQGFKVSSNQLIVILSLYVGFGFNENIYSLLTRIFKGMTPDKKQTPIAIGDTVKQINESITKQNLSYWSQLLYPLPPRTKVPGLSLTSSIKKHYHQNKFRIYRELSTSLTEQLTQYSKSHELTLTDILLTAWGNLLNKYYHLNETILAMTGCGELLSLFPIKVKNIGSYSDRLDYVHTQLTNAVKYSTCKQEQLEDLLKIKFKEYFSMIHHFIELKELNELDDLGMYNQYIEGNAYETNDTDLNINYHLFDDHIGLHYIINHSFLEIVIDNLHALYIDELNQILCDEKNVPTKGDFFEVNDTTQDKLRKLEIAQIALYLKNSGLFEMLSVEHIMQLAEECTLTSYMANDIIFSEKQPCDQLAIIGEGLIEENRMANDGLIRSLRLLKKGDIFGIESLLEKPLSLSTYEVICPQAKIVLIDRNLILEIFKIKSDFWIHLLEKGFTEKDKLQQLWMMQ